VKTRDRNVRIARDNVGVTAPPDSSDERMLPRPVFRSIALGMFLMAFFTIGWALGAAIPWASWGWILAAVAALIAVFLVVDGIRLFVWASRIPGVRTDADRATGKRMGVAFGIVFGVEAALIAAASGILASLDLDDLIPVVIALIVAVHFYPMAWIFRRTIDYWFATFLTVVAVVGLIVMVANPGSAPLVTGLVACAAAATTAGYGLFMAREHRRLRTTGRSRPAATSTPPQ
jgi:hypothetical protein